jgi:hypothetical protein
VVLDTPADRHAGHGGILVRQPAWQHACAADRGTNQPIDIRGSGRAGFTLGALDVTVNARVIRYAGAALKRRWTLPRMEQIEPARYKPEIIADMNMLIERVLAG